MVRALSISIAAVLLSATALGQSFAKRLEHANDLLRSGDAEAALGEYRDLQIDDPESDLLYYGIGCAHYKRGQNEAELNRQEDAVSAFEEAKEAFEKVAPGARPDVRRDAEYNLANATAQVAKLSAAAGNYEETVAAFEESVARYEEFLRKYPDHEEAKHNLAHMRYLLKKMLQNPPPPQEQQSQDQQQEQSEDNQEDKEGEKQDQQEQEAQQEEQQESQPEPQEGSEQEPPQQDQEAEPKDRQTIEAILESLEDLDKREQQETRNRRYDVRMGDEWW